MDEVDGVYDRGFICSGSLLVDRLVKYEIAFTLLNQYKPVVYV